MMGRVFDIQRFSTHDGPGIRTVVFFKGCPLRCEWCSNPESQKPGPDIFFRAQSCIGCGKCEKACPAGVKVGRQGADSTCTYCGSCVRICPPRALEWKGRSFSVDEVLEEISRDAAFYSNSGGGVTLSGGEPLMQPEFAAYIANEAHAMGYHTAIETTGYADWDHARKVLDKVDLVLYDFKHADSATHMAYTAARNELIVENLGKSVSEGYDITARVPFIRGFNASAENVAAMVDTLSGCGVKTLNILPYHTYGENKYAMLRREYTFRGEKPPEEEISAFIDICRGGGIAARID